MLSFSEKSDGDTICLIPSTDIYQRGLMTKFYEKQTSRWDNINKRFIGRNTCKNQRGRYVVRAFRAYY